MEPGKELNEVIEEVTVNSPTMAAAEESVVVEEKSVAPEPVAPEAPKADGPVFADKPKKNGKGMAFGMVLLALLAAGGIGFGVWAWMEKDEAEKNLAIKITETSGKVTEMITDKITSVSEDGMVMEITDTNITTAANPEDYVYIGEWGIKIKIPDNLKEVSYIYNSASDGSICFNGSKYDGQHYGPDFLDVKKNPGMGCLVKRDRNKTYAEEVMGAIVFSQNDYDWYYVGPQVAYSTDESEKEWEVESVNLIKEMLSTPDNYSEI